VAPTAGGCFVAAFVAQGVATLALLHTQHANVAVRPEVLGWALLDAEGGLLGKRKADAAASATAAGNGNCNGNGGGGGDGEVELVAEVVANGMVAAVEAEIVTAQRVAIVNWLNKRGLRRELTPAHFSEQSWTISISEQ
jgi:hypothetical protein